MLPHMSLGGVDMWHPGPLAEGGTGGPSNSYVELLFLLPVALLSLRAKAWNLS